jgi:hypothetical protein
MGNIYIIDNFIGGVETGKEALFIGACHFIRNTWQTIIRADNTVICGIESELDNL